MCLFIVFKVIKIKFVVVFHSHNVEINMFGRREHNTKHPSNSWLIINA
jgi:hypothetical protein